MEYVALNDLFARAQEAHTLFRSSGNRELAAQAHSAYNYLLNKLPMNAVILNAYGAFLADIRDYGAAFTFFRASLELQPDEPSVMANTAGALAKMHKLPEARELLFKAIRIAPDMPELYNAMAIAYGDGDNPLESIKWAERALELKPDYDEARYTRGWQYLHLGDYDKGFEGYRFGPRANMRSYTRQSDGQVVPEWDGKTAAPILVHGEQGLGDEVLFGTCLPDLVALIGEENLYLDVNHRMVQTFQATFPKAHVFSTDIDQAAANEPTERVKFITPLGTLPYWFRRSAAAFPTITNYLKPDPAQAEFAKSLLNPKTKNIGFAWIGGTDQSGLAIRSIPLHEFIDVLGALPDATWHSLQYNKGVGADVQAARVQTLIDLRHDQTMIDDITKQVAFIAQLDAVVTVTMSVCDFAGGVGTPCFTLVPTKTLWRFGGDDSARLWYSSERLFRQKTAGDWSLPIGQIKAAVKEALG